MFRLYRAETMPQLPNQPPPLGGSFWVVRFIQLCEFQILPRLQYGGVVRPDQVKAGGAVHVFAPAVQSDSWPYSIMPF
jgi:hypothetical protein